MSLTQGDQSSFLCGSDPRTKRAFTQALRCMDGWRESDTTVCSQAQLKVRADAIREKIATLRLVAKKQRLDGIAQLKEAIAIATTLGIKDSTDSTLVANNQAGGKAGGAGIVLNIKGLPLYFRGYRAAGRVGTVATKEKRRPVHPWHERPPGPT